MKILSHTTNSSSSLWTKLSSFVLIIFVFSGCSSTSPSIQTDIPSNQLTFDGLAPVKGVSVNRAWARPGLDLTGYDKILPQNHGISFRPGGSKKRTLIGRSSSKREFFIDSNTRKRFASEVDRIFAEEMAKSNHFGIAEEIGSNVLIVRGSILDVVSFVPPERAGQHDIFLSSVGEATLVLEIVDSESSTVLVRVADRRAAANDLPVPSNRVTNWSEVKKMIRFWARMLRTRMDEMYEDLSKPITE